LSLILESENPRISTFENEDGKFFRSFLISTKDNDAGWKIDRKTGHDKVKSFIGKNFAIIPELIQKPISQGGGGHWKGTREEILKAYENASHGKIKELVGPFYYPDSPEDYYYDGITKLSNSRSASVLHNEGQKTWNGYDVSPHIGVNKGKNEIWEDWEALGLNLVIRGAYGPQAIITKFCSGNESKCFKDLVASSSDICDEKLSALITSHLTRIASTPHSMADQPTAKPEPVPDTGGIVIKDKTNPTTDPQKGLTDAPKLNETVSISKEELDRLKERADAVTEMENERKAEILSGLFSVFDDEKERDKEIRDYSKLDMKTVKMLKLYTEKLTPKLQQKIKAELKAEAKEEEKEDEENGSGNDKDAKKAKSKEKERSASSLDKEPKKPKFTSPNYNEDDSTTRQASVPEIRNEVYLLRQKFLRGRQVEE
jgi:hypothetical protein